MKKAMSVLLAVMSIFSFAVVYANTSCELMSSQMLRLHIIAASGSDEDNEIKFSVRDYLSERMPETKLSPYSREYAAECERLANKRLSELGAGYKASATFEKVYIPKKSYKNITLPSGRYNAIRIKLGDGSGENWWCVAYPPLCFTEDVCGELSFKGTKKLKEMLPSDIYEMITEETKYRLIVVDLIGKIIEKASR